MTQGANADTGKRKAILDAILRKHKAQPVGWGYIDIIVHRDSYRAFVADVLRAEFKIDSISWWEHVEDIKKNCIYGMGGPKSRFFGGWFAEIGIGLDELQIAEDADAAFDAIVTIVENKQLQLGDLPAVTFKTYKALTPAFWLDVDDSWRNEQEET